MHKEAPSSYGVARDRLLVALGFPYEWHPLLIAIDGRDGAGKSSLASWLAWQLSMPAIHLDMLLPGDDRLAWRMEDLQRLLDARVAVKGPVIVEGILVQDALASVGRGADYVILVENEGEPYSDGLMPRIRKYWAERDLPRSANYRVVWEEPRGVSCPEADAELQARLREVRP